MPNLCYSFTSRPIKLGTIPDGLERIHILPSCITTYRKGKSIEDLTLNHMMFLENIHQFYLEVSATFSDDIKKFFDHITSGTQIVALCQHGCPSYGYVE